MAKNWNEETEKNVQGIVNEKSKWQAAHDAGDEDGMKAAAENAKVYYKNLTDSGNYDINRKLNSMDYTKAKNYLEEYKGTVPTKTQTDYALDATKTAEAASSEHKAFANEAKDMWKQGYQNQENRINANPMETEAAKVIMDRYRGLGEEAKDNVLADGSVRNDGNMDSFAKAQGDAQRLEYENAGVDSVFDLHKTNIEAGGQNYRDMLDGISIVGDEYDGAVANANETAGNATDISNANKTTDANIRNLDANTEAVQSDTKNQEKITDSTVKNTDADTRQTDAETEAIRSDTENQVKLTDATVRNTDADTRQTDAETEGIYSSITGEVTDNVMLRENEFFNDDGTLINPEIDYTAILNDARERGDAETAKAAERAIAWKVLNVPGYSQYSENIRVSENPQTQAAQEFDTSAELEGEKIEAGVEQTKLSADATKSAAASSASATRAAANASANATIAAANANANADIRTAEIGAETDRAAIEANMGADEAALALEREKLAAQYEAMGYSDIANDIRGTSGARGNSQVNVVQPTSVSESRSYRTGNEGIGGNGTTTTGATNPATGATSSGMNVDETISLIDTYVPEEERNGMYAKYGITSEQLKKHYGV